MNSPLWLQQAPTPDPNPPTTVEGVFILLLMTLVVVAPQLWKAVIGIMEAWAARIKTGTDEKVSQLQVFRDLTKKVEDLTRELHVMQTKVEEVTTENRTLKAENAELKLANATLTTENADLKQQLATSEAGRTAAVAGRDAAQAQVADLAPQLAAKDQVISDLRAEMEQTRSVPPAAPEEASTEAGIPPLDAPEPDIDL